MSDDAWEKLAQLCDEAELNTKFQCDKTNEMIGALKRLRNYNIQIRYTYKRLKKAVLTRDKRAVDAVWLEIEDLKKVKITI